MDFIARRVELHGVEINLKSGHFIEQNKNEENGRLTQLKYLFNKNSPLNRIIATPIQSRSYSSNFY